MKKNLFLLLVAVLLMSTRVFAQSTENWDGDVNKDGRVDVADIVAVIDLMQIGQFFYLGTTQPTADNYMTLPGVVASYTSINEAIGATAFVKAGETLYMLCPVGWINGKIVEVKDGNGNNIKFLEDVDAVSIQGHVIYRTSVWNNSTDVSFINKEIEDLQLSSSVIRLMTGYGGAVRIVSGNGIYQVESNNEDVATASITQMKDSSYVVLITAVKAGEATLSVVDNVTKKSETILVTVDDEPEYIDGKYVDMGLPSGTLWATCNVGADAPEEYGMYVSWGETEEKSYYSQSDYWLFEAGNTIDLNDGQDLACVKLEKGWRMPTMEELKELLTCTWSWEKYNGVQGARVIGPNGNSIFLPAASFKDNSSAPIEGTYGSYWGRTHANTVSSTPCGAELVFGTADYKTEFSITNFYFEMGPTGWCYCGRSVRPVYDATYDPDLPHKDEDDYTSYIVNPGYNNGNYNGWEGTPLSGYNSPNNAEHYNRSYDTYQTISGLPKGTYRLGVQGFYRKGTYSNDYSLWTSGDTGGINALLYATSSVASVSTPLVRASSAALKESLSSGSVVVGDNLYIPDDMKSAAAWFAADYYHNYLDVKVGDDGVLVIGIKKDQTEERDWTIIDNWTLFRIGE